MFKREKTRSHEKSIGSMKRLLLGGRIRTCGLPDYQSGRDNRSVCDFNFKFSAKKKSFQLI